MVGRIQNIFAVIIPKQNVHTCREQRLQGKRRSQHSHDCFPCLKNAMHVMAHACQSKERVQGFITWNTRALRTVLQTARQLLPSLEDCCLVDHH